MEFCKQEMPPSGGYAPLHYKKIPSKSWSPYLKLGIVAAFSGAAYWLFCQQKKENLFSDVRARCARVSLVPLVTAEMDRAKLKYLKKVRDEEEKVMKDVPGWEVGMWRGFPVYFTIGANEYYYPSLYEVYKHTDGKEREEVRLAHKILY